MPVVVVIALISVLFVSSVREQLWQQSIGTIRESTQQGVNTLRVQLQEEYRVMESLANYLKKYTAGQTEELDGLISSYSRTSGFCDRLCSVLQPVAGYTGNRAAL